jgi:hypothetical protein
MKTLRLSLIAALSFMSCSQSTDLSETRDFNLKFSYGVSARNVLNTFENTYTKDLIMDGTITVPFKLSCSDLKQISDKMIGINFFTYPDTFFIQPGDTAAIITPCNTYDFEVSNKSVSKHLYWVDEIVKQDTQAIKLRELISFIKTIVQSKPEYSQLPPAKGGYL